MRIPLLIVSCFALSHSKTVIQKVYLEPIFRFTDAENTPRKSVFFTKLSQPAVFKHSDVSDFSAVRGSTMEMFLKDLSCGVDTCQNFPLTVTAVYNVIDVGGRSKFEINPSSADKILAKSGYLSTEWTVGLHRYDEYYSAKDNLFAYTNNYYPAQFHGCQYRDRLEINYEFVRTLGYAFEPVSIPENMPIYSLIMLEVNGTDEVFTSTRLTTLETTTTSGDYVVSTVQDSTVSVMTTTMVLNASTTNSLFSSTTNGQPISSESTALSTSATKSNDSTEIGTTSTSKSVVSSTVPSTSARSTSAADKSDSTTGTPSAHSSTSSRSIGSSESHTTSHSVQTDSTTAQERNPSTSSGEVSTTLISSTQSSIDSTSKKTSSGSSTEPVHTTSSTLISASPDSWTSSTKMETSFTGKTTATEESSTRKSTSLAETQSTTEQSTSITSTTGNEETTATEKYDENSTLSFATNSPSLKTTEEEITNTVTQPTEISRSQETESSTSPISVSTDSETTSSIRSTATSREQDTTSSTELTQPENSSVSSTGATSRETSSPLSSSTSKSDESTSAKDTTVSSSTSPTSTQPTTPTTTRTTTIPYVDKYFKAAPIQLFKPAGSRALKYSVGGVLNISPQSTSLVVRVNETKACAFSSQVVKAELEKCGPTTVIYQWINQVQGFLRLSNDATILPATPVTWVGEFAYAFKSDQGNRCGFPLVPLKEMSKTNFTKISAGDQDETIMVLDGYKATGRVLGYGVNCDIRIGENVLAHYPKS